MSYLNDKVILVKCLDWPGQSHIMVPQIVEFGALNTPVYTLIYNQFYPCHICHYMLIPPFGHATVYSFFLCKHVYLAKCFCNMFFGFALTPICDKHCILGAFHRLTTCVGFPVFPSAFRVRHQARSVV